MNEGLLRGREVPRTIARSTHPATADTGARVEPYRERTVALADGAGAHFSLCVRFYLSLQLRVGCSLDRERSLSCSAGALYHLIHVQVEPAQDLHDLGSGLRTGELPRKSQEHQADLLA